MLTHYIFTILISLSPIGEARSGIPYGVFVGHMPLAVAFTVGLGANLLIFPIFFNLINFLNKKFWASRKYRQWAVNVTRKAKKGTQKVIDKYGFIGLFVFVMIPAPFTGAYMGTIAAYLFRFEQRKAFWAVSLGVICSSLIVAAVIFFGDKAVSAIN